MYNVFTVETKESELYLNWEGGHERMLTVWRTEAYTHIFYFALWSTGEKTNNERAHQCSLPSTEAETPNGNIASWQHGNSCVKRCFRDGSAGIGRWKDSPDMRSHRLWLWLKRCLSPKKARLIRNFPSSSFWLICDATYMAENNWYHTLENKNSSSMIHRRSSFVNKWPCKMQPRTNVFHPLLMLKTFNNNVMSWISP